MKRAGTGWLAWPAILYLGILFLAPTSVVLGYSFLQRDYHGGVVAQFSLVAWTKATDLITLRILTRSVGLALFVTLADLLLGYPCAAALARLETHRRQLLVVLISFPLVTSLLLRTYGWMYLLPGELRGNLVGIALVLVFNYFPFMVLPLLRSYERADASLLQAALDLGATPWQAFWRVTWPITRSGMWAGAALVFIPVMGEYLVPTFVGNGQVELIGITIWKQFEQRNWPYAAACAVWLAAIVLVPMLFAAVWRSPAGEEEQR
jgi:spermidine/putrescine transport system permease protein